MKRGRPSSSDLPPDAAVPKGGSRQRLARANAAETRAESRAAPRMDGESVLATLLITAWAWGDMSTPLIQKIADAAKTDMIANGGQVPDKLDRIATLGTSGAYPNHTHRDLVQRTLKEPMFQQALSTIKVWTTLKWKNVKQCSQFILLPHMLFAKIYQQGEVVFKQLMLGGDDSKLGRFWGQMAGTRHFQSHPVKGKRDFARRCIPIGLHGDGVTVVGCGRSWQKQCDAWSWSSLLCNETTRVSQYLIFLCFYHNRAYIAGKETLATFYRHLRWSLNALFEGRWPTIDPDGSPIPGGSLLAGGYYAATWLIKGDLDYFQKSLGLESPGGKNHCIKCACNHSTIPWTTFHPTTSAWMNHIYDERSWRRAHPNLPEVFDVVGVGYHSIAPDWMHTKHLGCDQYCYGSVLMYLCHHVLPKAPKENLMDVWVQLEAESKRLNIKGGYNEIRQRMFEPKSGKFPLLKGKAYEVKVLAKPLLKVWRDAMDNENRAHRNIEILLEASVQLEDLLEKHKDNFRILGDDADRFKDACFNYVASTSALGKFFHPQKVCLFHFTVKFHYMLHFALTCHELSPRTSWCYAGEDMMMKTKSLVQSSARGTSYEQLVGKVMSKYSVALSLEIMGKAQWWR